MYGNRRQVYGGNDGSTIVSAVDGPKTPRIDPRKGYSVRGRRPECANPGDLMSNAAADRREKSDREYDTMIHRSLPMDDYGD